MAKLSNPTKEGDFYISYYYFNSNTKINGYYKLKIVTPDSSREFITEFDVNTKIGWNKLLTKFESEAPNRFVCKVTDITDYQGNWIIGVSGSFSNFVWRF